jgi:hypothetical protein
MIDANDNCGVLAPLKKECKQVPGIRENYKYGAAPKELFALFWIAIFVFSAPTGLRPKWP